MWFTFLDFPLSVFSADLCFMLLVRLWRWEWDDNERKRKRLVSDAVFVTHEQSGKIVQVQEIINFPYNCDLTERAPKRLRLRVWAALLKWEHIKMMLDSRLCLVSIVLLSDNAIKWQRSDKQGPRGSPPTALNMVLFNLTFPDVRA